MSPTLSYRPWRPLLDTVDTFCSLTVVVTEFQKQNATEKTWKDFVGDQPVVSVDLRKIYGVIKNITTKNAL